MYEQLEQAYHDMQTIISRLDSGDSLRDICNDLGFQYNTIRKRLQKMNVDYKRFRSARATKAIIMKKAGLTIEEIRKAMNCDDTTVRRYLSDDGLVRNYNTIAIGLLRKQVRNEDGKCIRPGKYHVREAGKDNILALTNTETGKLSFVKTENLYGKIDFVCHCKQEGAEHAE